MTGNVAVPDFARRAGFPRSARYEVTRIAAASLEGRHAVPSMRPSEFNRVRLSQEEGEPFLELEEADEGGVDV